MPVPSELHADVRQWLSDSPEVLIDANGDDFHAAARLWLKFWEGLPEPRDWVERHALLLWFTRYQMALVNAKELDVSLGNDRLSQAFWAMIVAVVGAGIVASAPASASALISAAAFVAIASGIVAIGHAVYSIWKNARKARRHRIIQRVYDGVERIVRSLYR